MTKSRFQKISREPLHDKVYHELRSAIMAGRFAPGERLTVRGIADEFGVSAMPVRAALTRLVAEKIATQNATGGVELPKMSHEEYLERIELRALLEGRAAALAAAKANKRTVSHLEKLADALSEASVAGDARGYVNANKKFKFAVVEAAASEPLQDLVSRLWLQVGPFMYMFQNDVAHQAEIDRHHQVVDAIREGDAERARVEMERDILDGIEFLKRTAPED
ncbi:GntR family transcriptional regulator [Celeribacter litoreus]|uniref:GntR family transcriptional regulator n=1 Tax=Celeribacter litoreus TaxID=2876714 RepID=UPI001CCB04A8|nr:GntR family transcriptional regulator [Celeribacter litoreus]MCA0042508.1 GntR family transcriptional regulator [Celeribacter litoreus]